MGGRMIDFLYLIGTVGFFALMLAYVRACEALGDSGAMPREEDER